MKRIIFICFIALLSLCNVNAQKLEISIEWSRNALTPPVYSGSSTRSPKVSVSTYGLSWNIIGVEMWRDLALSKTRTLNPDDNSFLYQYVMGKIVDANNNYILIILDIEENQINEKQLLVSLTNDTFQYIDSVCVDAFQYYYQEVPYYPMSWRLTPSMNLTTSQLVPQSAEPIYVYEQHVQFPITAQRVDTHYTITPTGRFVRTGQTHYKPKSYTATEFMNENYNTLRDGTEEPLGPGEFEGPQPEVNPDLR